MMMGMVMMETVNCFFFVNHVCFLMSNTLDSIRVLGYMINVVC